MNLSKFALTGAALLLAAPMFASTYFGGFEDTTHGDYDYNDIVFSLTGNGLTLKTLDGAWFSNPTLGTSGNPFWNHASFDGPSYNVGYCIYGGGNCNGGAALDPNGAYLANAKNPAKASNFVSFSVDGNVGADVILKIAADNDVLGWTDSHFNSGFINPGGGQGVYSFHPVGDFTLFGTNISGTDKHGNPIYGTTYSSFDLDPSEDSHFAFFATPEPGTMGIMAGGLIAFGALFRRRKSPEQK